MHDSCYIHSLTFLYESVFILYFNEIMELVAGVFRCIYRLIWGVGRL